MEFLLHLLRKFEEGKLNILDCVVIDADGCQYQPVRIDEADMHVTLGKV